MNVKTTDSGSTSGRLGIAGKNISCQYGEFFLTDQSDVREPCLHKCTVLFPCEGAVE